MSTRFKKNVLKPENYNDTYRTQWTDDEFSYMVEYLVNDQPGSPLSYTIIGSLYKGTQAEVKIDVGFVTEQDFIAGYKRMVKRLKRIGKVILSN